MTKEEHPYQSFFYKIEPALESKLEEFEMMGYGKATKESLWMFLTKKKWKKPKDTIRLHEIVNDILRVKPGDYMNFETVEAFRSPNWFSDINEDELNELLRPKK